MSEFQKGLFAGWLLAWAFNIVFITGPDKAIGNIQAWMELAI